MSRKMKASGVEGIEEIPEEWQVLSIKNVSSIYGRIGFRGYTIDDFVEEGKGAITLSPTNIINGKLDLKSCSYLSWKKYEESPEIMIFEGDIIFVKTASVGKVAYVNEATIPMTINPQFVVFKYIKCNKKLLYYLLFSSVIQSRLQLDLSGGVIKTITQDNLKSYKIPLSSPQIQQKIAIYLDEKVIQIDSVIEKTKETIGEYKALKQSIITEAVTKGLNKDVEKINLDSEWIGEIPKHWKITKVKNVCNKITDGAHISPESENGIYDFISTVNISNDRIDFTNCLKTSPDSYNYMVRTGCKPQYMDVLISKDGTVGKTIVVDIDKEFVISSSLVIMRPNNNINSYFLDFALKSNIVQEQLNSLMKGAGLKRVSVKNNSNLLISLPPIEEQKEIVQYLEMKTGAIERLIHQKQKLVEEMEYYKKSLIYECVTGKREII